MPRVRLRWLKFRVRRLIVDGYSQRDVHFVVLVA